VAKRAAVVALLEITSTVHQTKLCILKAKGTAAAGKGVAVAARRRAQVANAAAAAVPLENTKMVHQTKTFILRAKDIAAAEKEVAA